jgi:hypothetical protein
MQRLNDAVKYARRGKSTPPPPPPPSQPPRQQQTGLTRWLVCPKCHTQADYAVVPGRAHYTCVKCNEGFDCLFAKVRAKRSRGNKKVGTRVYSIRLLVGNDEQFIEF